GPLYSALRLQAADPAHAGHELSHHAPPSAHGHHSTAVESPDWLAALELCGYCELLTLNPPLTLTPWLLLPVPRHSRYSRSLMHPGTRPGIRARRLPGPLLPSSTADP